MIRVREATCDDFANALPMLTAMGNVAEVDPQLGERFANAAADPSHLLLVAERDGSLLGYVWAQDYGPHLRSGHRTVRWNDLFVDQRARRQGVGRALFIEVEAWARKRGVRWLQWQASESAVGFYERQGLKGDPCPDPTHPFFEIEF